MEIKVERGALLLDVDNIRMIVDTIDDIESGTVIKVPVAIKDDEN